MPLARSAAIASPAARWSSVSRWWAPAYGAALVLALTWPFFVPGEAFALRDMMVFDAMALTRASLGWGDLPARNVPQDALLGILPSPVLFVRVFMVAAAAGAAPAGKLMSWESADTPVAEAAPTREIPLGTAYAVWTGIGSVGTIILGTALFGESLSPIRLALLMVLIGALVGLKLLERTPSS